MSAFRPKGRSKYLCKIHTSSGWVNRPTHTRDAITAKKMQAMVDDLTEAGATDVLDALGAKTVTLRSLWALWLHLDGARRVRLNLLRIKLADADLLASRTAWNTEVRQTSSTDTANHYDRALQTLVDSLGGSLTQSAATTEALKRWIGTLPGKTGTRRKFHAGVTSFFRYCVSVGALPNNPMRDVPMPPPGKARDRHLSTEEARALADAQPSPYRELSALLAGTGIEVGVALQLVAGDVDVEHREIRARGTKTHNRDRIAKVASWAWPDVERLLAGKLPGAKLFDRIPSKYACWTAHNAACKALQITNYTNRDARHTYAVRMVKAGTPLHHVAMQLGHANTTMVSKIYGVYVPTQRERENWESIASARDESLKEKKG